MLPFCSLGADAYLRDGVVPKCPQKATTRRAISGVGQCGVFLADEPRADDTVLAFL
jgi:hypothetical protein